MACNFVKSVNQALAIKGRMQVISVSVVSGRNRCGCIKPRLYSCQHNTSSHGEALTLKVQITLTRRRYTSSYVPDASVDGINGSAG